MGHHPLQHAKKAGRTPLNVAEFTTIDVETTGAICCPPVLPSAAAAA
jgi:hypothetical protein